MSSHSRAYVLVCNVNSIPFQPIPASMPVAFSGIFNAPSYSGSQTNIKVHHTDQGGAIPGCHDMYARPDIVSMQ